MIYKHAVQRHSSTLADIPRIFLLTCMLAFSAKYSDAAFAGLFARFSNRLVDACRLRPNLTSGMFFGRADKYQNVFIFVICLALTSILSLMHLFTYVFEISFDIQFDFISFRV